MGLMGVSAPSLRIESTDSMIQGSKNISTKMLKDVGITVPNSRETSAVCSNTGHATIIISIT